MGHYYVTTYARIEASSPEEAETKAVQALRPVSPKGMAKAEGPPRRVWEALRDGREKTPTGRGEARKG